MLYITGSLLSRGIGSAPYRCSYWRDFQGNTQIEYRIEAQDVLDAGYLFEDLLERQRFLPESTWSQPADPFDLGIVVEEMTPEEVLFWERRENELAMEMAKQPELFSRDRYLLNNPTREISLKRLRY